MSLSNGVPANAVSRLLRWFKINKLPLPWRGAKDPYAVWISETMLQQTQIKTVIPYYHRFLERFPTVESLARAPLDEVLKTWEGLGYYARARNLHKTAQIIVSDFGGKIPRDEDGLRQLKGVGRYTAAAIASIAFNRPTPVVDGNVKRVLARLLRIESDLSKDNVQDRLHEILKKAIPEKSPGQFNQAIMELGQRICIPRQPRCPDCPVRDQCKAYKAGVQDRLPLKVKKRAVPEYEIGIGIVWKGDKILIGRRPEEGLLGGLWEFPGGKRKSRESFETCVGREIREETGLRVRVGSPLATVRHRYSHFGVTLHVFHCNHPAGKLKPIGCPEYRWVTLNDMDRYAFPTANRKIIQKLRENRYTLSLF